MSKLLILDFDGTITDAEQEGVPFCAGYLEDIATLTGLDQDKVEEMAATFRAEVAADPASYGWLFNGQIVAPASVDPYLRMMPIGRKIMDACKSFMNEQDRTRLLDGILYKYNYLKTITVFKDQAYTALRRVLHAVGDDFQVYVVTNSHTEPVRNKLIQLGQENNDQAFAEAWSQRVFGRAKKYVLQEDATHLPESMALPGLPRPVLLRREFYNQTIETLCQKHGATWSDVTVVGDIFELDLSLPLHRGARVGLMVNDFTPDYEKNFLQGHERGHLLQSVMDIAPLLGLD